MVYSIKQSIFKSTVKAATHRLESALILDALNANGWSRKQAASALGISYRAILYKMEHQSFLELKLKRLNQ